MQVKVTSNPSKGYLHSFQTLLTSFPTSSKGHYAVTLPPIDDGGTSERSRRNRCKRRSELPVDDISSRKNVVFTSQKRCFHHLKTLFWTLKTLFWTLKTLFWDDENAIFAKQEWRVWLKCLFPRILANFSRIAFLRPTDRNFVLKAFSEGHLSE